jgi:hypothetical protein
LVTRQFQAHVVVFEALAKAGGSGRPQADLDFVHTGLQARSQEVQVGIPPGTLRTQAQDGVETDVRRVEAGGRVGDRGVGAVRGAHDRGGLDGPVDREDASRAEGGREGDVKPGGLGRRGGRCQIKIDTRRRTDIGPGGIKRRGLAIVPVGAIVAGAHNITDPVGILGRISHERAPSRRNIVRGSTRVGRQYTAIGRRLMFPVVEFI